MREWEQHKTDKWVSSSAYAYAYVAGVLTCLCLCYDYAYAPVRTTKRHGIPCEDRSFVEEYDSWSNDSDFSLKLMEKTTDGLDIG